MRFYILSSKVIFLYLAQEKVALISSPKQFYSAQLFKRKGKTPPNIIADGQ